MLSYILVIAAVLVLLNIYPPLVSEDLVFRSKANTLQSSVSVIVSSLSGLERLTEENVADAMTLAQEAGLSRMLVTDAAGKILFDTRETGSAVGQYTFYTEVVQALTGKDVFTCRYENNAFRSRASSPVLYQNQIIGAVYAYEYDTEEAALLVGFQNNIFRISCVIGGADGADQRTAGGHPPGAGGRLQPPGRRPGPRRDLPDRRGVQQSGGPPSEDGGVPPPVRVRRVP